MSLKQISAFLENSPGRVAEVSKILAEAKVNISALVLSDTLDFGVLRLIVNDTDKAHEVLKNNNFIVRQTDVIIVPISHQAGSLSKVLQILAQEEVCIEYMYAFSGRKEGEAFAVFKIEDLEGAKLVLEKHAIKRLCENEL